MTEQPLRLPSGGRIDRTRLLRFRFDGRSYVGHPGDSLASALLANGVRLLARSFKYHRPRGVYAAGPEDPCALVELRRDRARVDPNSRAAEIPLYDGLEAFSQNRFPSLSLDLGAFSGALAPLFPAGFYYKTFKWPRWAWHHLYEPAIRRMAGLGRAPTLPDPDRYLRAWDCCDLLIVGGGAAGLVAAHLAARAGVRVVLVEREATLGGWLARRNGAGVAVDGLPAVQWLARIEEELRSFAHCRILTRTTAVGCYDHNLVALLERSGDAQAQPPPGRPRMCLWQMRAKRVLLATGAVERGIVFPDNDRPGIMLAGAGADFFHRHGVLPGREIVIFANHDGVYPLAAELAAAGARVALADVRPAAAAWAEARAREAGVRLWPRTVVVGSGGRRRLFAAYLHPLDEDRAFRLPVAVGCDALLVSGGAQPDLALFAQARGRIRFEEARGIWLPDQAPWPLSCIGAANGRFTVAEAIADAARAAAEVLAALDRRAPDAPLPPVQEPPPAELLPFACVPLAGAGEARRAFVDLADDVTVADLRLALREGYRSIEHVKRYTTAGMGPDQGKTAHPLVQNVVARELGARVAEVGATTFRQPWTPVPFAALVGADRGPLFDPLRRTPTHDWAEARGAVFEDVGQWKRARYFPADGEGMEEALAREAKAVRSACGMIDASTLGKIDVQGPDAARFLERVYTIRIADLAPGRCRYGLMLREDGMVLDDGVVTRLGDHHFHLTTTTGGAARVHAWLEEWLQTEWTDLRVWLTSVTEEWADIAVSGPRARELLARVVEGVDLAPAAFPHMSMREGRAAGVRARIFRISFTGELGYEINVPAGYGLHLWEALLEAGRDLGLTPYGTEAMHLLRAEKGYIIVGQETDGTVSPLDLGLDWLLAKRKGDFLGRRSLDLPALRAAERRQLVGLLPVDPGARLEEGAQIVAAPELRPPVAALGHVTSSYHSPNLGRSFALALLERGRERHGARLWVTRLDGPPVEVEVTAPLFWDPEGRRLRA